MRRLLLAALLFLLVPASALAASRYVAATGLWSDTGTWSSTSCTGATGAAAPTSADDVILCPGKTVTVPCNTAAALKSLTDDASWTSSDTGGLVADGSACSAGQVPTFTFTNTTAQTNVYLDGMGAPATFRLIGRSITTDAPWGEPSDLTNNCGGSDKTVNGTTWTTAGSQCSVYTWANKPFSASVPGSLSTLALGNLVWWTSGLYRNNYATVTASTSTTLTVGFGSPGDSFDTLALPKDVSLTAWDTSNPTRILATIQTGALETLSGAASGTGQRSGWCLVTSTQTATAGSGKFYRIAGSVDGGGSNDSLILDPWEQVDPADSAAAYLAIASNAWIAPCVKSGDRWYSFEPVVAKPATPGTDYMAFGFLGGLCPDLERVRFAHLTSADVSPNGTEAWVAMTAPAVGFYGQHGCTVDGPWAIGPKREIGVNGYMVEIQNTASLTIEDTSIQGDYWITSPADTVTHGWAFLDSANLLFDRTNVSFINNEAYYLHQASEEGTGGESDASFEGATVTIRNSTVHDVFHKFGLSDSANAVVFDANTHTAGTFSATVHDNIFYNVVRGAIDGQEGAQPYTLTAYSNVIGPLHRQGEVDTNTARGIKCFGVGGGVSQSSYVVNNVLLSNIDYNLNTSGGGNALDNCNAQYNYIGEWLNGLSTAAATGTAFSFYGNLIEAAGAVASTSILTTSSMRFGLSLQRSDAMSGEWDVRDLTVRRLCSLTGARFAGIQVLGNSTPPTTQLEINYTHNTFGLYCPEAAAATPTADSAGIYNQNYQALHNLATGSAIADNLFVTGDNTASTTLKIFPVYGFDSLADTQGGLPGGTKSFTFDRNLCSQCDVGANTCGTLVSGRECCRNCSNGAGAPYTFNQTGTNLERFSPARRMGALGIRSSTDTRLVGDGGLAFAFADDDDHIGARYSGIINFSQSMKDAGLPQDWLFQRATMDDEPDRSVIPEGLRFLYRTGGGGGGGIQRAF